jgi:Nif11 domain
MSLQDARALYDHIREDHDLTKDLFRQALQDPQGTLQRLMAIAGERGLEVNAEDVQHFLQDEAPNSDGQWLLKARGGL